MSKALSIKKKIEKVGASGFIEKRGDSIFDEATRVNYSPVDTHPIKVIIDSTSLVALGEIFGPDLVKSEDLIMYTHNLHAWGEPMNGDSIIMNDEKFDVITRRPIFYKRGEIVMWKMLMRNGKRNDSRSRGQ